MAAQINLYDPALRRQRHFLTLTSLTAVAIGLTLLIALLGVWEREKLAPLLAEGQKFDEQIKALQDRLVVLGREANERKPDPVLAERLAIARVSLQTREQVLDILRRDLAPEAATGAELLRALSRAHLEGVWITGLHAQAGGRIEIRGRALEASLLPDYLARLNAEALLRGRSFAALDIRPGKLEPQAGEAPKSKPNDESAPPPFVEFTLVPAGSAATEKKS